MPDVSIGAAAAVSVRRSDGGRVDRIEWSRVSGDLVADALPWRRFRWRNGQQHFSGTYWATTEAGHVVYESRLELARLLMADFDRSVTHIVAQPFLLETVVAGKVRRHVPDYLLFTGEAPILVDVKPRARLAKPIVVTTFAWTRELVEGLGWRYEIASEPDPVLLDNIRFLAG
ncbi:TnsA-like heteromeric transposase endonuclease subunit [Nocardia sp. BSTN01]|uniref:TnsA-like heteromeric transposase endonuclease subunit n=1 Tax=Nocardia sp. BSTN01 TaxID=2783665 RepID=UPI00188E23D5|nr:TnsA-like heteromeric transposase endonuclease subunit [Nocardia sp. BSTN01]MBF5001825.1 TnsA-like heteromeric transposase endonuclease subunit [Nocardia sp. BSTN01]